MNSTFIEKKLLKLKSVSEWRYKLFELNIDISDCDYTLENDVIELIAHYLSKEKPHLYQYIIDDIKWWLYELNEKIIKKQNGVELNVNDVKDYVNFLFNHYDEMSNYDYNYFIIGEK